MREVLTSGHCRDNVTVVLALLNDDVDLGEDASDDMEARLARSIQTAFMALEAALVAPPCSPLSGGS